MDDPLLLTNLSPKIPKFEKYSTHSTAVWGEGRIIYLELPFFFQGIILKWKGYEDNDPRRVEAFVDITEVCKVKEAIEPLDQVLKESILFNGAGRKRYHDAALDR